MDYSTLETAIVTALAPIKSNSLEVMAWPDSELEFSRAFTVPRVSVVYHSSEFKPVSSASESIQDETVMIQVMIESRNLRGTSGVYFIKDQVLDLLQGLIIPNWTRLSAVKFDMAERSPEQNAINRYNLVMKTTGVRQQILSDYDPDFAALSEIDSNITYGTSV